MSSSPPTTQSPPPPVPPSPPTSSVSPADNLRMTRSMTNKRRAMRKHALMPLSRLKYFRGPAHIKEMFAVQSQNVSNYIDSQIKGGKTEENYVTLERIPLKLRKFENESERRDALTKLGVVWLDPGENKEENE